jgi:hypothetical protein
VLSVDRRQARHSVVLFIALLPALAVAQESSSHRKAPDVVWTWSKQCNAKQQLNVLVRLGSRVLYQGFIPICQGSRDTEDGRVDFGFVSGHLFGGQYRAPGTDKIEGDIWQAGGETDALVLGVSFATKKQILLNTLHVASTDKKTSSELDKGLSITTYPVSAH